jgi:hypothetical protein
MNFAKSTNIFDKSVHTQSPEAPPYDDDSDQELPEDEQHDEEDPEERSLPPIMNQPALRTIMGETLV